MPTVMRFDDPRLVATLGSQASAYATNQDDRAYSLQVQELAQRAAADRERFALQQQQNDLASQLAHPQQQMVDAPGYDQVQSNGAVFHMPGQRIPAGQMGAYGAMAAGTDGIPDGRGGAGGLAASSSMGYLHPQQRLQLQQIDKMEQAGQLHPAEAARWRMIVQSGGNPFTQPTTAEEIDKEGRKGALSAYQKGVLAHQEEQLTGRQAADQQKLKRQAVVDELKVWNDTLKAAAGDPEITKQALAEIRRLTGELQAIQQQPGAAPGAQAPPATQPTTGPTSAPAQAPAAKSKGSIDIRRVQPADADELVRGYGSADAARRAIAQYGSTAEALAALRDGRATRQM